MFTLGEADWPSPESVGWNGQKYSNEKWHFM